MIKKQCERSDAFAWDVVDRAPYAVLALSDTDGTPYCVPISPVRRGKAVYFHCAAVGKKLELLKKNPRAALTAVSDWVVDSPEYTMRYSSAVAQGTARIVEDAEEKRRALYWLSERYSRADLDKFDAMMAKYAKAARIVRIDVDEITGKQN